MQFENVIVEKDGAVGVVTLNRPQALNALSYGLVKDLSLAMQALDQDAEVRVIIITGGEKVFARDDDDAQFRVLVEGLHRQRQVVDQAVG